MGSTLLLVVAVGGCTRDPVEGSGRGSVADPTEADGTRAATTAGAEVTVQPLSPDAPRWTAVDGSRINMSARQIGDVNGDGMVDALVGIDGPSPGSALVLGPLRRSLSLPGDEQALIVPIVRWTGDLTGDGVPDFLVDHENSRWVLTGPLDGEVASPEGVGLDVGLIEVADLNGDGIGDKFDYWGEHGVEHWLVTWGPTDRWQGPPDLDIEFPCASWTPFEQPPAAYDLNGDGIRELWASRGWDCGVYYFDVPSEVSVVAPTAPSTPTAPLVEPLDDQNGDGVADLWVSAGDSVLLSPFSFDSDGFTAAAERPLDQLHSMQPLAADVDGDGVRDFVGLDIDWTEPEVELTPTTGDEVDHIGDVVLFAIRGGRDVEVLGDTAWYVGSGRDHDYSIPLSGASFVENDTTSVLVSLPDQVVILDLH